MTVSCQADRNREWALTVTEDRAAREVALSVADAMEAAASHLRASASALRGEFGLPSDRVRGLAKASEALVDHVLNALELDLPVNWLAECACCVPRVCELSPEDLEPTAGRVRERVEGVVKSLVGVQ